MSNRRRIASVAFTGAAAATAIGMGTPAAFAASTWTVKPPNTPITGTNSTPTLLTGPNGSTSVLLTCPVSDASLTGRTAASSQVPGPSPQLATITGGKFGTTSTCTSSAGALQFTATIHSGKLIGSGFSGSTTTGTLKSISATLSGYNSSGTAVVCTAPITGFLKGTYKNTGVLTALDSGPTLTVGPITGGFPCSRVISNSEPVGFKGSFKITPTVTISKTN